MQNLPFDEGSPGKIKQSSYFVKILLHNSTLHSDSVNFYHEVNQLLQTGPHETELFHHQITAPLETFDILISNDVIPSRVRSTLPSYGGKSLTRPDSMKLVDREGLPTMAWSLAADQEDLLRLFKQWNAQRILLKKSHTYGGDGVIVFGPEYLSQVSWDPREDLFCREVNPRSGDVYKAELFHGEIIISWMSEAPPLREITREGLSHGVKAAYGERRLFEFPLEFQKILRSVSLELTRKGFGYVSIDFMRAPDGSFQAIEINLSMIATWWTGQFDFVKKRYANAIRKLADSFCLR